MKNFDLQKNISAFTEIITRGITSGKVRREIAQEYADHIEDEVYNLTLGGMSEEEAFHAACENLGAPENYGEVLAEIHNKNELPDSIKEEERIRKIGIAIAVIIAAAIIGAFYYLWGFFVFEVIAVSVAVYVLIHIKRYAVAFYKRVRVIKKIKKLAEETGCGLSINRSAYTSVFKQSAVPAILFEIGEKVYKIRFFTILRKNQTVKFFGKNIYSIQNRVGLVVVQGMYTFSAFRRLNGFDGGLGFKPEQVTDMSRFARFLPTLEKRHDDKSKTYEEVILFNPVPMRILYNEHSRDTELIGGERRDGVYYYDAFGFCNKIRREKEGEKSE